MTPPDPAPDLAALQDALRDRLRELAPALEAATLAETGHTARPYGVALRFPGGQSAYIQIMRAGVPGADRPDAPGDRAPNPAPVFAPGHAQVRTADLETLLAAALATLPAPLCAQGTPISPTARPGGFPFGVRARYPGGTALWLLPFLLLAPGEQPAKRLQHLYPAAF